MRVAQLRARRRSNSTCRGVCGRLAADPGPDRVHTGDAIHEADRFFGTTVHYAARVASQALGGEVLVSNLVRELVTGPDIAFLEGRDVELKGLDGEHRLFAVALD